jgi:hypothetical protein
MNEVLATNLVGTSARDSSGKPEVRWICVLAGLVTDSPVPLRLEWQDAKK